MRKEGNASQKRKINIASAALLGGILLLVVLGYLPHWLGYSGWGELLFPDEHARAHSVAVHFIDVGQGDSILLMAGGEAMLIDGGERGQEETVIRYLREQGVRELRYVVNTHPHSDHLGGLAYGVLEAFSIREVIAPRFPEELMPTTRTYERFLNVMAKLREEQGTKMTPAQPGKKYKLGEGEFTVLGPIEISPDNMNNNSVVIHFHFKDFSVLLMGDAEKAVENQLVGQWGTNLRADILKAGHHGSKTSSNKQFLDTVQPEAAAITCGSGNGYKHPHDETLQRLENRGITIYRTDLDGDIVICSDGVEWWKEGE